MPNVNSKVTYNFVDAKGYYAHSRFIISWDTAPNLIALANSLATALSACSNALFNGGTGAGLLLQIPNEFGGQFQYGSVEDKALMTYVALDGSLHRFQIPAPVSSIFLADEMTVDKTNVLVVSLNQIILNAAAHPYFVATRAGGGMGTFGGGVRIRRRNQRRITIFTRAADDVTPAE